MRKTVVFEHFLLCKYPKELINCRILWLFAARFYKPVRLLDMGQGTLRMFVE
jgi:hypothetical protein